MSRADAADTFRQEAQDLLEQIEQSLLDLETDPGNSDLINGVFRAMHTLKGSGAMFGFQAVADFAHNFETAFDKVRKGLAPPDPALVAVALDARDHLRALVEDGDAADPAAGTAILERLRQITHQEADPAQASGKASLPGATAIIPPALPVAPAVLPQASPAAEEPAGPQTWRVRFSLPADALVNGCNPLLLLDELRGLGPCTVVALTDRIPPLDQLDPEKCYLSWDVIITTPQPRSAIEDVFIFVLDEADLRIEAVQSDRRIGEILIDRGDAAPDAIAEVLAEQTPVGLRLLKAGVVSEDRVRSALAEQQHTRSQAEQQTREADKSAGSLRVQAERLDELMDRVGELVIAQARLTQIAAASADAAVKTVAEELERLAAGLRDITMGIRMVPMGTLFTRFRRLVHDLSRDLSKEIDLVTSGEETELDKTMIERLGEPLIHLIRNAIDHGLELPEERLAAGKPRTGSLRLQARHAGAEVQISVIDDGKGLDTARIRTKAIELGLLSPDGAPSDADLYQFLFHPGFSTARTVTAVSGRGVGMDVVKRAIESLRGSIEVSSAPGAGTSISLKLPLTLAIIDGLLVRVGPGRYVIPLSAVEECVELPETDLNRHAGRNFLNIRGALVPYLRLREMFAASALPDPYQKAVIVTAGDGRVGLVVDQIIGSHQTVIKSLSRLHADIGTFSGATILGDGTVALILDIGHLVDLGQKRPAPAADSTGRRVPS